jgi:hypothetical protein
VASNFAFVASVAALVAYIAPYSPPFEPSSQAALLHVQMIVGVDSTQLENWTVYCNSNEDNTVVDSQPVRVSHTHTHTHTHIYIYIYILSVPWIRGTLFYNMKTLYTYDVSRSHGERHHVAGKDNTSQAALLGPDLHRGTPNPCTYKSGAPKKACRVPRVGPRSLRVRSGPWRGPGMGKTPA